jgi:hypothetical protein
VGIVGHKLWEWGSESNFSPIIIFQQFIIELRAHRTPTSICQPLGVLLMEPMHLPLSTSIDNNMQYILFIKSEKLDVFQK